MINRRVPSSAWVLGLCLVVGLGLLGYLLGDAALRFKALERSVTVKGLSEREYPADRVIWPISFSLASNDLNELYAGLESGSAKIRAYLLLNGVQDGEISLSVPLVIDRTAQGYAAQPSPFRYTGQQTVTVFSEHIERVRAAMGSLSELGKQGIVLSGDGYRTSTEYLFTRLNEVKPAMIEEATRHAREVALKFAADSASDLGKIRRASQGQFVIQPRDSNNPHIKRVRVVATVEYYLAD